MNIKHICILGVLAVLAIQGEIMISCNTDNTCPKRMAYTITNQNNGESSKYCTDQCGTRVFSSVYEIKKCQSDITGNPCQGKVCALLKKLYHCRDDDPNDPDKACASSTYNHQITCGDCKNEDCSKCITKDESSEVCYGKDVCDFSKISGSSASCPNNLVPGQTKYPCNCCNTVTFDTEGQVGECITDQSFGHQDLSNMASQFADDDGDGDGDGDGSYEGLVRNSIWVMCLLMLAMMGEVA